MNEFIFLKEMNNGVCISYPSSDIYRMVLPSGNMVWINRNRDGYLGYNMKVTTPGDYRDETLNIRIADETEIRWDYYKRKAFSYHSESGTTAYIEDAVHDFCKDDVDALRRIVASLRARVKYTGFVNKSDEFVSTSLSLAIGTCIAAIFLGLGFAIYSLIGGWGIGTAAICIVFAEMVMGLAGLTHVIVSRLKHGKQYQRFLEALGQCRPED